MMDTIAVAASVLWNPSGDDILSALRYNQIPTLDSTHMNKIFGNGKNGIRDRAWLCIESGHLKIETLRMKSTTLEVEDEEDEVLRFEMKVTLSMKNVVYSVYIVFDLLGLFLHKLSKYDCLNRWLLCSHTLSCSLLFHVIQTEVG